MRNDGRAGAILRHRLPSLSDTLDLFAVCVIPVYIWAILSYLDAFPGFALRLDVWDLVGTAGYTLAFALAESLVLVLPLLLLAALLPSRFFKDHLLALGSIVVLISSLWLMAANRGQVDFSEVDPAVFLPALALYLISLAVPILVLIRFKRVEPIVRAVVKRAAVLGYVYAALGCLGLLIVLIRNL